MPHPLLTVPNLLSLSRLPLGAVLFALVAAEMWAAGVGVFVVALVTDWADGWWARRYGPLTAVGRALDPLTDKVLIGGAFIYLMPVPGAGLLPWMVTVVIGRELVVTGVRGMVESAGMRFGADWFGKLKTALQAAAVLAVLVQETVRAGGPASLLEPAEWVRVVLVWAMLVATVGSGVQYLVRAAKLLGRQGRETSGPGGTNP